MIKHLGFITFVLLMTLFIGVPMLIAARDVAQDKNERISELEGQIRELKIKLMRTRTLLSDWQAHADQLKTELEKAKDLLTHPIAEEARVNEEKGKDTGTVR